MRSSNLNRTEPGACLTFGHSASRLLPELQGWWRAGEYRVTAVRIHGRRKKSKEKAHTCVGLESDQGEEDGTAATQSTAVT